VEQQTKEAEKCICTCFCQCPGELYAMPSVSGIELRFPLEFIYRLEKMREIEMVCRAGLKEESLHEESLRPSLVLRMVEQGEELWDIAKAYATTQETIMLVNNLEEGRLPVGRLLMIPKKR